MTVHIHKPLTVGELEQLTSIAQQNFAVTMVAYLETCRETVAVLNDFIEGKDPKDVAILIALHNRVKSKSDVTEKFARKLGLVK